MEKTDKTYERLIELLDILSKTRNTSKFCKETGYVREYLVKIHTKFVDKTTGQRYVGSKAFNRCIVEDIQKYIKKNKIGK